MSGVIFAAVVLLGLALLGLVVRRWALLLVLLAIWIVIMVIAGLTGDLHDYEWTPAEVAVVATLFTLCPALISAAIGVAIGKSRRRRRDHAAAASARP